MVVVVLPQATPFTARVIVWMGLAIPVTANQIEAAINTSAATMMPTVSVSALL